MINVNRKGLPNQGNDINNQSIKHIKVMATPEVNKQAVDETAKALDAIKALDLMTASPEKVMEVLKPFFKDGFIVGVVDQCKEGQTTRNETVSSYNVKVVFPTVGNRVDAFGNGRIVNLGYWLESFKPVEVGEKIEIDVKRFAIVIREVIKDDRAYKVKSFVDRNSLIGDGNTLREGYSFIPNADMTKKGTQMTVIQNNSLFTLRYTPKEYED